MKGRIPLAWILAALVLLIGGSFRLSTLGWLPLAPKEASVALTAAADTELASPFWSPSQVPAEAAAPAYTNPTAALMSGLGADPAIARLVPALAGVIFMCLPLLLLRRLGWVRVLLSMLLLSISPTALTVSRSAGGEMLAALGLTLAAILLVRSRSPSPLEGTVAGVSLGAGIASGPAFWTGLFGFCLAYLLFRAFSRDDPFARVSRSLLLRRVVPTALLTALVLATWFGSRLGGLGDALAAAGSWIMGWTRAGGMPLLPGVFVFPIYEPLVLVMGTIAAVRGINPVGDEWRPPVFLGIGSLAAFVLYPSRSAADLIWVIMPAAVLAVGTIESTIERTVSREMPQTVLLLAAVLLGLFGFAYLQLEATVAGLGLGGAAQEIQVGYVGLSLLFSVFLLLLFGIGWSWVETWLSLGLSLTVALSGLTISNAWRLNFDRMAASARELWRPQVNTLGGPLLEETLRSLAVAHVGRAGGLTVDVQGEVTPTVAWVLRDHVPVDPWAEGPPPPVLLALEGSDPSLPADYLGQAFGLTERWGWSGFFPPEPFAWLVDREAPTLKERWVLYVRTDVAGLGEELEIEGGN